MEDEPNNLDDKRRKPSLSQTDVPSVPIDEALRVPRAIADHLAKAPSPPLQVAAAMGIKPTTGYFRKLAGAALAYGLTEGSYGADVIRLTELGRQAVAPTEEGADLEARRVAVLRPRVTREFL